MKTSKEQKLWFHSNALKRQRDSQRPDCETVTPAIRPSVRTGSPTALHCATLCFLSVRHTLATSLFFKTQKDVFNERLDATAATTSWPVSARVRLQLHSLRQDNYCKQDKQQQPQTTSVPLCPLSASASDLERDLLD